MKSSEIRQRFLTFFEKRGHIIIPSASLVPTDEKGITDNTLFNSAGMQPLIPYLLGEKHPSGTRLVDSQKCLRTTDLDEVGDNTHATFFEMLGNWSLGDYFKEEAIQWSFEFLTSKEEGLGLDPERLYVTVFEGDENAPRDEEAYEIWKKYIPENRIYFMGAKSNWWSAGDNGPCGPDTEMFYDLTEGGLGDLTKEEYVQADDRQDVVEVWNNVFMEYEKRDGKIIGKLPARNVDTGAGLERLTAVVQGKNNIFETDFFSDLIKEISKYSKDDNASRVIADHMRSSVFMIGDGILPSNSDRGYILRRLIRRMVFNTKEHTISNESVEKNISIIIDTYNGSYPEIESKKDEIKKVIVDEISKFTETLEKGLKEFNKISSQNISGKDAFVLFSSYGFPIDLTKELAKEKGIDVDMEEFEKEFKKHQDLSRSGGEQKFKGGLAGTSDQELKYHTATHLLHAALHEVLGENANQKGSNITAERLRFDFSHGEKMTEEEKQKVEEWVNDKISKNLDVIHQEMTYDEAKEKGATGLFEDKYGDEVSVYSILDGDKVVSRELCGGPHVENTGTLGKFKIKKEEASSAGVRRIKAVLE